MTTARDSPRRPRRGTEAKGSSREWPAARSGPPRALEARKVPGAVRSILARLGAAGHRSWLVGGVVRDLLLGRERHDPHEFDVATPATPQEVERLFRRVIPTGVEHGTVTVLEGAARVEVTTFRGEGAYVDGRRPSSVTFHTDLEADLSRRDFTINALAWDPISGEFRDLFGGLADLRRGIVRAVGEPDLRFGEDGLRPLRAARFVAQLGFRLDRRTKAAVRPALPVVAQVSRERVAEELARLVSGGHAASGIRLLAETGLLSVAVPALVSVDPDLVRHAVAVACEPFEPAASGRARAREAHRRERLCLLRLAALLHVLPAADGLQAIVALRLSNRLANSVAALVAARPCPAGWATPLPEARADVRGWLASLGPTRAADVLDLWAADARHQGRASRRRTSEVRAFRRRVAAELRSRPPLATADLALDGRGVMDILGIDGGREVGEALRHLLHVVLEDPARNHPAGLETALRAWWSARPAPRGSVP